MTEAENGVAPEADDLFSRWLAHHVQQTSAEEKSWVAESERGAAEPVTVPELRSTTDMERQTPGFEPVIMPSIRKQMEQSKEPRRGLLRGRGRSSLGTTSTPNDSEVVVPAAPDAPAPTPAVTPAVTRRLNRSVSGAEPDWLRDLRAAAAAPDPDAPAPADPVAPADRPAPAVDVVEPEPEVVEDTVETETEAEAEPEADADELVEPAAEPADEVTASETDVLEEEPDVEPDVDPEAVTANDDEGDELIEPEPEADADDAEVVEAVEAVADTSETETPMDENEAPVGSAEWISRLRDGAPTPAETPVAVETVAPAPAPEIDWRARFRDVGTPPAAAAPMTETRTEPVPAAAAVEAPGEAHEPTPKRTSITPLSSMPAVYPFKPRHATRILVTTVFVLGLAGTAYLLWQAYLDPAQTNIVIAATAAFATAVLWAIRATTTLTRLTVRNGQLEVQRDGNRSVFDLGSEFTPVKVVGTPGRRGWRVVFERRGMPPFVVDSSIVDPVEFSRVLRHHRPDESVGPAPTS